MSFPEDPADFGRSAPTRQTWNLRSSQGVAAAKRGRGIMDQSAERALVAAAQRLKRSAMTEGKPFPLGATWNGLGVNFALFSANATRVELCLFDERGERELERIVLPEYTD